MSKLYCKMIDGVIAEPSKLPPSASSITDYGETINPSLLSDDILSKHYGFYLYRPPEDFDEEKHTLGTWTLIKSKSGDFITRSFHNKVINIGAEKGKMMRDLNKKIFKRLSETDWYIIRKNETGEDVPEHIASNRLKIRKNNNLLSSRINSLRNPKDVIKFQKLFYEKLKNI